MYDVNGHAHHIILLSASHLQNMSKKVLRARHYLSVGIIHLRASRTARQSKPRCVPLVYSAVSDPCDPTDCSLPGSSVHGILEVRVLEWVAISSSRESSWLRD